MDVAAASWSSQNTFRLEGHGLAAESIAVVVDRSSSIDWASHKPWAWTATSSRSASGPWLEEAGTHDHEALVTSHGVPLVSPVIGLPPRGDVIPDEAVAAVVVSRHRSSPSTRSCVRGSG
jgi:hypothetical protein